MSKINKNQKMLNYVNHRMRCVPTLHIRACTAHPAVHREREHSLSSFITFSLCEQLQCHFERHA